jgi:hypothetical protein
MQAATLMSNRDRSPAADISVRISARARLIRRRSPMVSDLRRLNCTRQYRSHLLLNENGCSHPSSGCAAKAEVHVWAPIALALAASSPAALLGPRHTICLGSRGRSNQSKTLEQRRHIRGRCEMTEAVKLRRVIIGDQPRQSNDYRVSVDARSPLTPAALVTSTSRSGLLIDK